MAHGKGLENSQESAGRKRHKYQLAFEQSRDAIMFSSREGFQDCNSATLAMFRVPDLATFVTIHPADLSPLYQPNGRLSREAAEDHIDEALSKGQAFFKWHHRTWDGVDFPSEVLLSRIDMEDDALVLALVRDISDRNEAAALRARERDLADAQRLAHVGSWVSDFHTNEIRWSDELYRIFGLNRGESFTHESFMAAVHPSDRERVRAALETSLNGKSYEVEYRIIRSEGEVRTVQELGYTELDAEGKPLRMTGTLQDTTLQRQLEDKLREEKTLSESILAGLPGIFYIHDGQGHLVQWNDRMEEVTGFSHEELDGMDVCALIPQEERDRVGGAIAKTFSQGSAVIESKLCTVEGDIPYLLNGLRVELNDQSYLLGVGLDIAKQKQLEESLEREATTDALTRLYNRQRFDAEMERALASHARYGAETALVMLDVDHFKKINDTYGHDVGDWVLVELTKRVAGELREPDFLARWGGEEFVALLPETDASEAARMGERLRRRIEAEPFPEVGVLTISLGVTNFRNGDTPNTLLKRADTALYKAKDSGRNRVMVSGEDGGA
ncbi:sensor domain-containing diguanylate cyclase [Marinimicrobium sp. C2-29]|uniref:sensor domain-containing diguanylate cyclase n=1 Tax=Marinimicrobium sp. C2-29 TaxID=3139825 RepID=UPI0031398289